MSRTPPAKSNSDFIPCPAGTWNALCVDITEPYEMVSHFQGAEDKYWGRRVAWQISKPMENGNRFVVTQRYRDSQHTKSNFRKVIKALLGRDLNNDEEGFGVEMESLVNRPCMVTVEHNKAVRDGQEVTYANVTAVVSLPEGMPPLEHDGGWTRWVDRDADEIPKWYKDAKWKPEGMAPSGPQDGPGPDDEPLPF